MFYFQKTAIIILTLLKTDKIRNHLLWHAHKITSKSGIGMY